MWLRAQSHDTDEETEVQRGCVTCPKHTASMCPSWHSQSLPFQAVWDTSVTQTCGGRELPLPHPSPPGLQVGLEAGAARGFESLTPVRAAVLPGVRSQYKLNSVYTI